MRDDAEADECVRNHITMETIIGGLADSSLGVAGSTDWSTVQYSKCRLLCARTKIILDYLYQLGRTGRISIIYQHVNVLPVNL